MDAQSIVRDWVKLGFADASLNDVLKWTLMFPPSET